MIDSPSSSGYDEWVSSYNSGNYEVQTYTFFNLTNVEEVEAGLPPKFDPLGPFTYRRNSIKVDPYFTAGGAEAVFKEMSTYTFVPSESATQDPSKLMLTNFFPFYQAAVNKAGSESALLLGLSPTVLSGIITELATQLGDGSNNTLGLAQWGNLGISGTNMNSPPITLYAPPVRNFSLPLQQATQLLFGANGLVSDPDAVPTFFGYLANQDIPAILAAWPELGSPAGVLAVAGYIDTMIQLKGIPLVQSVFFQGGRGTGLIVTHTLDEWLWKYQDPLLAFLEPTLADLAHLQFNDTSVNMTRASKQNSVVYTGAGNLKDVNAYKEWNGRSTIDVYTPPGLVFGTNGRSFGPEISPRDSLHVFVSEIQRPLQVLHVADSKVKGIKVFEYRLNPTELRPSEQYQSPISGLFNIAPISYGIPLEISKPFFLNADPALAEAAGLVPDYGRDSTYLDVEPMTGISFRASLKLQINVRINSNVTNVFWPKTTSGVWPLVAIHRDGIISDKDADAFKRNIRAALIGAKVALGLGLAFGILALIFATYVILRPNCARGVGSGYSDLSTGGELPPHAKREDTALLPSK